jgi:hypothetical protein
MRGLSRKSPRRIAVDLLESAIAAQDRALTLVGDADHRVVENQLLLPEAFDQGLFGRAACGDVLKQPDVAFVMICRVEQTTGHLAPDRRAIGLAVLDLADEAPAFVRYRA